jgi:ribonuclease VapC
MIIDTSAIIAILRDEPEAMSCARAIADATERRVSAVNFVESAVVIEAVVSRIFRTFDQATAAPVSENCGW